jgi:hypothetical protein
MSGYSEKVRVPVLDGKPENFNRWEIQWNAFVEVEGIIDALGSELDTNIPADATVLFTEEELTSAVNAKKKVMKDNRKCIAFYAITLKQMKLLRLLTKILRNGLEARLGKLRRHPWRNIAHMM